MSILKTKVKGNNDTKKKKKSLLSTIIPMDPFGNIIPLKRMLIGILAAATYGRLNIVNRLKVENGELLKKLPNRNVLFISNHQTYYADVMAFYHIFCSSKWKMNNVDLPLYALNPRVNVYYVAAEETMNESGLIPKIFSYTGAVTVKRSWRASGQNVKRGADLQAPDKIKKALSQGWVVTFPQGTTSPFAPVRKGTASMIKALDPIVVPIVIDGFRRAFDKKGLFFKKRGTTLKIKIKEPLQFDKDESLDSILEKVKSAIEQNPERKFVPKEKIENTSDS